MNILQNLPHYILILFGWVPMIIILLSFQNETKIDAMRRFIVEVIKAMWRR